jgi:two-component sensor histidine kinase/tetratricopeptide (TPR) repeat protein
MLKAGCLLVFLALSQLLTAQQRNADFLVKTSPVDTATPFKKWLSGVITAGEKDTALTLKTLNEATARARAEKNLLHEALIQRAGGQWMRNRGEYHRSFAWYMRSYNLFDSLGNASDIVSAGLELSKAQYFRGNYRQSMQHYSYAVEVAAANKITDKEIESLEILGLLYNAFQNFTAGAAVFRKSLDMKYQLNDEVGVLYTLEILSTIYYRHHKFDSSLMYANHALQLAQKQNKQSDIELCRLNSGAALIRLKRMPEAYGEINELSKLDVRGSNVNRSVRYNVLAGNYFLALNNDRQANTHYNAALAKADQNLFPELYALIYNNMADSYYERGDLKMAYQYSRKYTEMMADLYTGENVVSLGNLETVLKTERSADEIRYLNNENQLKQLQLLRETELRANLQKANMLQDSILRKETQLREMLSRENVAEKKLREVLRTDITRQQDRLRSERRLRLLLLMAVTAMLVLGAIIFYLYRKQRRKNAIIVKQADDMQVLMKEIHHRVKNNLQVISSLLDLQALSIKHDQAAEAVKEGRNRVQSMALIHQNLYNEGNIKGIKVQHYIETLAQGLFHSYNIKTRSVHLTTDIDDLNLDVDTVIPIGLILNELITNSLKYAFRDKEYGEIWVTLKKAGDNLVLKVRDNGDGFPPDASMQPETTFGIKLIRAFAQKLKARLSIYNDNGACVEMQIARYKIAEQTRVSELV